MRGTRGHTQPLQKQGKTERSSAPKLTQGATPTRLGTQRIPGQTDCGQAMGYPRNTSIHPASSRVIRRENTRLSMHPAPAPCHQIIGSIPERLLDRPFPGEQMEGAAARMGLNKVVPVPKFVLARQLACISGGVRKTECLREPVQRKSRQAMPAPACATPSSAARCSSRPAKTTCIPSYNSLRSQNNWLISKELARGNSGLDYTEAAGPNMGRAVD